MSCTDPSDQIEAGRQTVRKIGYTVPVTREMLDDAELMDRMILRCVWEAENPLLGPPAPPTYGPTFPSAADAWWWSVRYVEDAELDEVTRAILLRALHESDDDD